MNIITNINTIEVTGMVLRTPWISYSLYGTAYGRFRMKLFNNTIICIALQGSIAKRCYEHLQIGDTIYVKGALFEDSLYDYKNQRHSLQYINAIEIQFNERLSVDDIDLVNSALPLGRHGSEDLGKILVW